MTTLDFSAYIADRTRDFTGREWVFAEIDAWLADPDALRFFFITGEPGIGKTAIAARLTQVRTLAAIHFCIARQADTIDPLNFVRSLSYQLTRFDGFAQSILKDQGVQVDVRVNIQENYGQVIGVHIENLVVKAPSAAIAFNRSVLDLLKHLFTSGFSQQLVILVDALDEAVQQRGPENIVDLLVNAFGLPSQVRFVLTSRPDNVALRHFKQQRIPYLLLDAGEEENQEDVQEYVRYRLETSTALQTKLKEHKMESKVEALIGRIVNASEGNFLYLTWFLSAIAEGIQRFDQIEALPKGLDGIYREFLLTRKAGGDVDLWRSMYRLPLGILVVAQSPLTAKQLRQLTDLSAQEVSDFLLDMRQFLDPTRYDKDEYQLYHQSLADFLSDRKKAEDFWIDPVSNHSRIAHHCLKHYTGRWSNCDPYGLRYILFHLTSAADWGGMDKLLTDFGFLEAKVAAGMVHDLVAEWGITLASEEIPIASREAIKDMVRFLRARSHVLIKQPDLVIQEAFSFASSGPVRKYARQYLENPQCPRRSWLRRINRPPTDLCLQTIPGHAGSILAVAVTEDGQKAVTGGEDHVVKVWNLMTGACLHTLREHTGSVLVAAVTADSRKVITGSEDKTIRVWDLVDGACLKILEGHRADPYLGFDLR